MEHEEAVDILTAELKRCPFCDGPGKSSISNLLIGSRNSVRVEWQIVCSRCGKIKSDKFSSWYEINPDETLKRVCAPNMDGTPPDGLASAIKNWNSRIGGYVSDVNTKMFDVEATDEDVTDILAGGTLEASDSFLTEASEEDINDILGKMSGNQQELDNKATYEDVMEVVNNGTDQTGDTAVD